MERQSALEAFRAVIKQLSIPNGSSLDEVLVRAYQRDEGQGLASNGPTLDECHTLLIGLLNKRQTTYIILDALDECEYAESQLLLVGFLRIIAETRNAKIFISSRHAPDIVFALQERPYHVIEPKDNMEDIRLFVQDWLDKHQNLNNGHRLSQSILQEIEYTLLDMANGMYVASAIFLSFGTDGPGFNEWSSPSNIFGICGLNNRSIQSWLVNCRKG